MLDQRVVVPDIWFVQDRGVLYVFSKQIEMCSLFTQFVQDQRVVPDIWDHKFLPVSRRSVAAPLPKDSAKYRAASYGAWYLPVQVYFVLKYNFSI